MKRKPRESLCFVGKKKSKPPRRQGVSKVEISPLTCTAEQLFGVVSRGNRSDLLLSLSNPAFTEDHVIALLRNPAITERIVAEIADRYDWIATYSIQFAIVNCSKSPYTLCMRLLPGLFWNDLLKTSLNYRLSPRIRRVAENYLQEKIGNLTLGEKINIARSGPRSVIKLMKSEKDPRVMGALLQNSHLVEDDVLSVINSHSTSPAVLRTIGQNTKWKTRYSVGLALTRNQQTPLAVALSFLSKLHHGDLEILCENPNTRELIRRGAERLLNGNY